VCVSAEIKRILIPPSPNGFTWKLAPARRNRVETRVVEFVRELYEDFGPTLAREKLIERHGIKLAKETIRKILSRAGIWLPKDQRIPRPHQPRFRRECLGELVQIDGCEHYWFEDRAPPCSLLVYVDDATSRLMELRFAESESAFSYFGATASYLRRHESPWPSTATNTASFA
jgi:hypothetical protein